MINLYFLSTLLVFLAFLPHTPLWLDIILFAPLGASMISIEFGLTDNLTRHGELSFRRDILFRSLAIAAVFGSVTMGMVGQAIGVSAAMMLVSLLYFLAGVYTWRWSRTNSGVSTN